MAPDATYDVFLSHATPDKPAVERLALRLKAEGLRPFLDKWHLVPGEPWQEAIEKAMARSRTCVVFVGPGPLGPWQNEEMRNALAIRVRDDSRRVIPVLLPGASMPELPSFLARLTWVDFRSGLDDPDALHRLLCGIRGIEPESGPAGSPLPPPPGRPTMIGVPHRNPFFTGREDLLSRLHQQLQTQGISALAQAAIYGLGGIGKTQTAIEYAHRFGEHYRFVLWVVAESEPALQSTYLSIARALRLIESQADLETTALAVKAWLSREAGWLLIFDNADDPSLVRPYLPSMRTGGKVLLTSRAKSFAKVGIKEPFRIETLQPEEAVKFLIERTGNAKTQAAAELSSELGYLPLALEQAAAYIDTVGGSFAEYLARYRRKGLTLLERGKPSTDYLKSVATTWTLSFDAVRETSPASAELLTVAAFLMPDFIPIEIFTFGRRGLDGLLAQSLKGATEESLVFWELLEPLERYSLLERLPNDAFKLHRLTQEVVKDSLDKKSQRACAECVIRALAAAYPQPKFENWKLCERLQPNARPAFELVRKYKLESAEARRLLSVVGYFAEERGDYAGAKLFNELSLEIDERVLGAEHPSTLMARNNLAQTLNALGNHPGARKLHEENLEISMRVLGGEHPQTLMARNNLAFTLHALGERAGARKLHEQNLEIRERVLGGEHPETLQSSYNLAATLHDLGDLAGARKLHERTLKTRRRILGEDNPDTLISTMSRAMSFYDEGRFKEASEAIREVLEAQGRVLGEENPATLLSRINLASALHALGDLAGARKLGEQTLEIFERVLGSEHPYTLTARNNLAVTLDTLGDLAGAKKLQEQTLEIRESVLGAEHPDTLASKINLASTIRALGDLAGAKKLHQQALEALERVLGREHPDTLTSMNNLAQTLQAHGDLAGARKLQEQTLEIRERVLGAEHPDTTGSTWNLLLTVRKLNEPDTEAQLINKLRWLLDRDEDSIPSADQRKVRQMLLDILNPRRRRARGL